MVDKLLGNEGPKKSGAEPYNDKWKKRTTTKSIPGEPMLNEGFNKDIVDKRIDGDTISLSPSLCESAGLSPGSTLKLVQTPTPYRMASVLNSTYSIYGSGASTILSIKDCLKNIRDWKKKYPELAAKYEE